MLKMIKGCTVPFPEKLSEAYEVEGNRILANVGADKIEDVLRHFIEMHDEPLFFILELPTKLQDEQKIGDGTSGGLHKDVYYIDGCSQEKCLSILDMVGDMLINDGLCGFGFGCHESRDEIMLYKYNVMVIFSRSMENYDTFFERHDIPKVDDLLTAWGTFSSEHPGTSDRYDVDGKNVFDIPELFKDWGMFFAERRED